jgi:hypothetical protein
MPGPEGTPKLASPLPLLPKRLLSSKQALTYPVLFNNI